MYKFCFFLVLFAWTVVLQAQNEGKYVRQGNSSYEEGDYEDAATAYRKGVEANSYSYEANFNLGNAMYQQGEYETAASQYDLLRQPGMDKEQLAKVYHNLGNSLLEQQKYAESVEAFKEALRNNPKDADTRYNLVYALEKLKEQQQQQQDQQNQDQNQDQQDQEQQDQEQQENQEQNEQEQNEQEQQQDQQNQEQENQEEQEQQQQQQEGEQGEEEQKQQQQGQEGEEGEEQQGQQQQAQPKDEISRAEAERILQAIQMDEQQLHDKNKKKKLKAKRGVILKDW